MPDRPYYEADGATIWHGDCLDLLPNLAPVDVAIIDPPYVIPSAMGHKTKGWGDMINGAYFYAEVLRRLHKLVTPKAGAVWCFTSWKTLPMLMKAAADGDVPIASVVVWDKAYIRPGSQLRPRYEMIALMPSEGFQIEDRSLSDLWRVPTATPQGSALHPAEKPEAILHRVLDASGVPAGGTALDCFMGSGTTLVAARARGLRAIGVEIERRYCDVAISRLAQRVLPIAQ